MVGDAEAWWQATCLPWQEKGLPYSPVVLGTSHLQAHIPCWAAALKFTRLSTHILPMQI